MVLPLILLVIATALVTCRSSRRNRTSPKSRCIETDFLSCCLLAAVDKFDL